MNRLAISAAAAAVAFSIPAFADTVGSSKAVENSQPVAASARTSEFTFDLRSQRGLSVPPIPPQTDSTFASLNEVKTEDFSFDLK